MNNQTFWAIAIILSTAQKSCCNVMQCGGDSRSVSITFTARVFTVSRRNADGAEHFTTLSQACGHSRSRQQACGKWARTFQRFCAKQIDAPSTGSSVPISPSASSAMPKALPDSDSRLESEETRIV